MTHIGSLTQSNLFSAELEFDIVYSIHVLFVSFFELMKNMSFFFRGSKSSSVFIKGKWKKSKSVLNNLINV